MTDLAGLERLIEPEVERLGYELVRVMMIGGTSDPTLQVMAERTDTRQLGIADCEKISRRLSEVLDLADPIAGSYRLEVSSPGIDRPLVRPEDYERFTGFEARIELARPVDGRKRFRGRLLGRTASGARLLAETGEVMLPFEAITRAKLVLNDELIAAAQHNAAKPAPSPQTH